MRGNLPLSGVTVVSVEQAVAAPFASRQLADLGARVIKIERPGSGDFARGYDETVKGMASHFVWLNRSKESLTLDLKKDGAPEVLDELIQRADVFLHNLAPGAVERLGFGSQRLRERDPRLICCAISGYGQSGPYRDKKAYDLLVQAEAGLLSITGTPQTPSKAGISAADIAAGMYAYSGILTALYSRERAGKGANFEVSLFEALGEWMGYPAYYTAYGEKEPPRTGASHAAIAPYGPFEAGDGGRVFLGLQNEREWKTFCEQVLEQPDLTEDSRFKTNAKRVQNSVALEAEILTAFRDLTADEAVERLETAGIANARMNGVQDFVEHPQLKARERWREVDSPAGKIDTLLPPVTSEDFETVMEPIPGAGQHTEAILKEIGFDDGEAERLRRSGVV